MGLFGVVLGLRAVCVCDALCVWCSAAICLGSKGQFYLAMRSDCVKYSYMCGHECSSRGTYLTELYDVDILKCLRHFLLQSVVHLLRDESNQRSLWACVLFLLKVFRGELTSFRHQASVPRCIINV